MRAIYLRRKILTYIPIIIFLVVIQALPDLNFRLFTIAPLILIPFSVCIGMFEREIVGGYLGLLTGLLWDISSPQLPGFHAIYLLIVSVICGLLITNFMQNNLFSAMLLNISALVIYGFFQYIGTDFSRGREESFFCLTHILLPQIIYSFIFIFPIYIGNRFLIKKIKR